MVKLIGLGRFLSLLSFPMAYHYLIGMLAEKLGLEIVNSFFIHFGRANLGERLYLARLIEEWEAM